MGVHIKSIKISCSDFLFIVAFDHKTIFKKVNELMRYKSRAFSLVELLVVMTIIGILAGIGSSTLDSSRETSYSGARIAQASAMSKAIMANDNDRIDEYKYILDSASFAEAMNKSDLEPGYPGDTYCNFYLGVKGSQWVSIENGGMPDAITQQENEFAIFTWDYQKKETFVIGTYNFLRQYPSWLLEESDFLCGDDCGSPTYVPDNSGDTCYLQSSHADCTNPQTQIFSVGGNDLPVDVCVEVCSHPGIAFSSIPNCTGGGDYIFDKIEAVYDSYAGTQNSAGQEINNETKVTHFIPNENWLKIYPDGTAAGRTWGATGR